MPIFADLSEKIIADVMPLIKQARIDRAEYISGLQESAKTAIYEIVKTSYESITYDCSQIDVFITEVRLSKDHLFLNLDVHGYSEHNEYVDKFLVKAFPYSGYLYEDLKKIDSDKVAISSNIFLYSNKNFGRIYLSEILDDGFNFTITISK